MSGHSLGLYWGERKQSIDECAVTVAASIVRLAAAGYSLDVLIEHRTGTKARTPFSPTLQAVREALSRDHDRAKTEGRFDEQGGYSMVLTSQHSGDEAYTVFFHVGCFREEFKNNVVLKLPKSGALSFNSNRERVDALRLSLEELLDPDRVHLGHD